MRWVVGGAADSPVDLVRAYAVPAAADQAFVRVNFATSIDGRVEVEGVSHGVSSEADREVFHVMRALCDVVLVGAQTVRAEGYGPVKASAERIALRRSLGFSDLPPIAVVTRSGDLNPESRMFTEAVSQTLLLVPSSAASAVAHLAAVAEIVEVGDESVDPVRLLAALHARGLTRVLCEGGPALLHALAERDLVDELCLTLSPLTAGGHSKQLASGPLADPVRFRTAHALEHEGSIFLRYARA